MKVHIRFTPSWRIAVAVIIGVACIAAAVVFACMMISADRSTICVSPSPHSSPVA